MFNMSVEVDGGLTENMLLVRAGRERRVRQEREKKIKWEGLAAREGPKYHVKKVGRRDEDWLKEKEKEGVGEQES